MIVRDDTNTRDEEKPPEMGAWFFKRPRLCAFKRTVDLCRGPY
jgi:hypothetical protein